MEARDSKFFKEQLLQLDNNSLIFRSMRSDNKTEDKSEIQLKSMMEDIGMQTKFTNFGQDENTIVQVKPKLININ